jgi:hypothetical protein
MRPPRRVPTEAEVEAAANLDDRAGRAWGRTLEVVPWLILGLLAVDPPDEVLLAGAGGLTAAVMLWLLRLSLRAQGLAFDRRRALNPGASWWALSR